MSLSASEKKRFLRALEEDREFRYAVAGYLGLSETLKRLDTLEESMKKLWEEVKALRGDVNTLKDDVGTLKSDVNMLKSDVNILKSDVNILKSDVGTLKGDVRSLKADFSILKSDTGALREDVRHIRTTLERLTLTAEEEARSVVKHKIKEKLNIDIELDRIFIDTTEVNIYGAAGDICVVGEATVRLGPNLVNELLDKVKMIRDKRPYLLRRKLIKVIYTDYATPEAVEAAIKSKVWILRWEKELTPLSIEEIG
jgi:outer membrane murein-binding lipoprotein Lpp